MVEQERKQILAMLEQGKITVDEAMALLNAVESEEAIQPITSGTRVQRARFLKIMVTDQAAKGRQAVNLKIPLTIVKAALKLGAKVNGTTGKEKWTTMLQMKGEEIEIVSQIFSSMDSDTLEEWINQGQVGVIVDIASDKGERVLISLEA